MLPLLIVPLSMLRGRSRGTPGVVRIVRGLGRTTVPVLTCSLATVDVLRSRLTSTSGWLIGWLLEDRPTKSVTGLVETGIVLAMTSLGTVVVLVVVTVLGTVTVHGTATDLALVIVPGPVTVLVMVTVPPMVIVRVTVVVSEPMTVPVTLIVLVTVSGTGPMTVLPMDIGHAPTARTVSGLRPLAIERNVGPVGTVIALPPGARAVIVLYRTVSAHPRRWAAHLLESQRYHHRPLRRRSLVEGTPLRSDLSLRLGLEDDLLFRIFRSREQDRLGVMATGMTLVKA